MANLTENDILDIQTSDEPAKVMAKKYDISHQKVNSLRKATQNELRKEEGQGRAQEVRAHNEDGTFKADDPATPENEAFVKALKSSPIQKTKVSKGRHICNGETTGYRDGKDGTVETCTFPDGWLPEGWHDTPADCNNCDGKSHPDYVNIKGL